MKRSMTAAFVAAMATAGTAQALETAQLTGEYYLYDGGDGISSSFFNVLGDATYRITPGLGVQVSLGGSIQTSASEDFLKVDSLYSLGLHGFYDISPDIRAGLLIGADGYDERDYLVAVEGVYLSGPIRGEGRLGLYGSDTEPATLFEVQGDYEVFAGLHARSNFQTINYEGDNGSFSIVSIGASYDVMESASVYAEYGATRNDTGGATVDKGTQLTVGVNFAVTGRKDPMMFSFNPFF